MKLFSLNARPPEAGAGQACVRNTLPGNPCQACVNACSAGVIKLNNGKVEIETAGCTACGACLFACPAGAIEDITPPERVYRECCLTMPLSLSAPSVNELLMWHAQYQIRSVEMEAGLHPGWLMAVAALNIRLKQTGEPLWKLRPPSEDIQQGSRRRWLHIKDDSRQTGHVTPGGRARRACFPQVTEYRIVLDGKQCTLCGGCARVCPELAIQISEMSFMLIAQNCTGCGNCETLCFEKAISVEEETAAVSEIFETTGAVCTTCRRPFTAWSADEKQCPVCRKHRFDMREA
ncbi:4Fe-4S binding protein [Rahnella sp. PCH160]|uniref:4Fe-4S binding protein n=1 Tax=Rahnella sp. PCH160 TaxID=3447928 RepID=UPI0039FC7A53